METLSKPARRGHAADDLDEIRQMILSRSRERRLSLADMSRGVGKNHSYMHQFLYRRTPQELPEAVRRKLAGMLDLPESQLRPAHSDDAPGIAAPSVMTVVPARAPVALSTTPPNSPHGREVPVFMDTDEIIPAKATEWAIRPGPLAASVDGALGIYVSRSRGRLRPGDLVFMRPRQPPRVGDAVVAIRGQTVEAIGDLIELSEESASIRDGAGEPKLVSLADLRLLKVAAAYFA